MGQSSSFCDRFFLKKRNFPEKTRYGSPSVQLNLKDRSKDEDRIFSVIKNEKQLEETPKYKRFRKYQRVKEPETPLTDQLIKQGIFLQPMMYQPVKQLNMMYPYQ